MTQPAKLGTTLLAIALAAGAQQLAADYQQILRPKLAQQVTLEDASANWDLLHFRFQSGTMAMAEPLASLGTARETTAVFQGRGELDVAAPNAIERQQMQLLEGHDSIAVSFTQAVFRFADGAVWRKALGSSVRFQPIADASPLSAILEDRVHTIEQNGFDDGVRQLFALETTPDDMAAGFPWLLADLRTADFGWIEADFDPLDAEAVEVHRLAQRAGFGVDVFDDVWTHFPVGSLAAAAPGNIGSLPPPCTLQNYDLNVTIPGNLDIQAQATLDVTNAVSSRRGLLLALDSNLRVTQASLAGGDAIEFLQPRDPGGMPSPNFQGGWLYLRLPRPLASGAPVRIALSYHGKQVVQSVGNGNFFARSEGWYPSNVYGPPFQRARFQLHFQNNKKYTLVATGVLEGSRVEGDFEESDWTTPAPLTVAGFALGDYHKLTAPVTLAGGQKVTVNVLVNNSPDDVLQSINIAEDSIPDTMALGTLDPKRLAPQAMAQVNAALQFMADYYGPYPYSSLSVVPIPGDYGQGWPGLLYLSSLSFLDSTQLHELGVPESALEQIGGTFRAHETSHQWWGHRVSWATPHDQWLSEGFANASALLFQQASEGDDAMLTTLRGWRHDLESKNRYGHIHDQVGPLWLGSRLVSSADPEAYQIVTYDKGGYVLYMLRQMLRDTRSKNPDAAFIAMMRDFTSTYANRDASTADFQAVVEKHMNQAMDLVQDGSMNWFFQEYVYGTGIPRLKFSATLAASGSGTKVTMTIDNPNQWRGLLPFYLWQDKKYVRGQVSVLQPQEVVQLNVPFQVTKVDANHFLDMLVDVAQ